MFTLFYACKYPLSHLSLIRLPHCRICLKSRLPVTWHVVLFLSYVVEARVHLYASPMHAQLRVPTVFVCSTSAYNVRVFSKTPRNDHSYEILYAKRPANEGRSGDCEHCTATGQSTCLRSLIRELKHCPLFCKRLY